MMWERQTLLGISTHNLPSREDWSLCGSSRSLAWLPTKQVIFIPSVSIWLILNSHSKRDCQIWFKRDYLNTHLKTRVDSIKTFRVIKAFQIYMLWAILESSDSKSSIMLVGFTLYSAANICRCAKMLPVRVCGIYFNITEIKIILFWNICKKAGFHIGICYSCLSIPELNTFQKTELMMAKLGHAFFVLLIRILINFFGDIHINKSSGILEMIACRNSILQHPNRTLPLLKAHSTL